jgi:hypothetical protein
MLLCQILQALQPGFTATNVTANGQMHYQGNETLQMMPAASFQSIEMMPAASFLMPGASFSPETFGDKGGHSDDFIMLLSDQQDAAYSMLSSVDNLCGEPVFHTAVPQNHAFASFAFAGKKCKSGPIPLRWTISAPQGDYIYNITLSLSIYIYLYLHICMYI